MDLNAIIAVLEEQGTAWRGYAQSRFTIQDVNTARSVADYFIHSGERRRSFEAFDMGIRTAVRYMIAVRRVVDDRLLEQMGASSSTLYDYFNRAMSFVETGKATGSSIAWDGIISAAIRNNAVVDQYNVTGNIGTVLSVDAARVNPRTTVSRTNLLKPLYTAPLSMKDEQLISKWVSHPGGFVEMLLFVARMVEICFQADVR